MKLILIQHAEAFSKEEYPDRPLTEEGCLAAEKAADFIRPLRLSVSAVWHSGKTRAMQTAKIFKAAVRCTEDIRFHAGLSPRDPVQPIAEEIERLGRDLVIVGHFPFLSRLASFLVSGDPDRQIIAFQKAGAVCLEKSENGWQAAWMVTPELL